MWRRSTALALCSAGVLLAVFSFAGAPLSPSGFEPVNIDEAAVSSGKIQLRPSSPISEIETFFSNHAVSQAGSITALNWQLSARTEPIRRYAPHVTYDAAHGQVVLFGGDICQG